MMPRETIKTVLQRTVSSRLMLGGGIAALGMAVLVASPAAAAETGKLVPVSPGASPFADCTTDDVGGQEGTNYPNTEIEPWVDANPADRKNLIAGWQQDRWSNGGSRGLMAGYSKDGGRTWTRSVP